MKKHKLNFRYFPAVMTLAIPVMLQNLLNTVVGVTDNAMVGVLGEVPLSSVTLANKVYFVFSLFLFGAASASSVIVSQYWGKRDLPTVRRIFILSGGVAFCIGLLFTGVCLLIPEQAMMLYTNDARLIEEGASYLRIIGPANIPAACCVLLLCTLRGVERAKIGLWLASLAAILNVVLNWMLIYGNCGFPAMGIEGAALATMISRLGQFVGLVVYFAVSRDGFFRLSEVRRIDRELLQSCWKEMAPILFNECMWGIGTSLYAVAYGHMGTDSVSAYSMASAFVDLMTVGGMGVGNGVSVLIGIAVGQNKREEAMELARLGIVLGLMVGVTFALITQIAFPIYVSFFEISESARSYAEILKWLMSVQVIACCVNFITIVGILRGGGDGRMAMILDLCVLWPVCIPMTFIGTFWLGWPVYGVYALVVVDEAVKLLLSVRRVLSGKWIRNFTKSFS